MVIRPTSTHRSRRSIKILLFQQLPTRNLRESIISWPGLPGIIQDELSGYVPLSEDPKYTNGTADFFAIDLYTAARLRRRFWINGVHQLLHDLKRRQAADAAAIESEQAEVMPGHGGKVSPMMQRVSWPVFGSTRLSNAGGASAVAKSLWWAGGQEKGSAEARLKFPCEPQKQERWRCSQSCLLWCQG